MNTQRAILNTSSILALVAISVIGWQQHRLVQASRELQRLRLATEKLPVLQQELKRLQGLAVDQAQLAHLRKTHSNALLEVAQLRNQATQARQIKTENTRLQADLAPQTNRLNEATNGISGHMAELMKNGLKQQSRRRLARMQEQLNLTPAQAQAMQDILNRRTQALAEATQGVITGKLDPQKIASQRQGEGDSESQIRALLTPEQQTAYTALQNQEKANLANNSANSEMLQMHHTLDLTEDQQKQVVNVLYRQLLHRYNNEQTDASPANPAEAEQIALERKLEALTGILTPTQLESYRQQQELHLQFLKRLVGQTNPSAAQP